MLRIGWTLAWKRLSEGGMSVHAATAVPRAIRLRVAEMGLRLYVHWGPASAGMTRVIDPCRRWEM